MTYLRRFLIKPWLPWTWAFGAAKDFFFGSPEPRRRGLEVAQQSSSTQKPSKRKGATGDYESEEIEALQGYCAKTAQYLLNLGLQQQTIIAEIRQGSSETTTLLKIVEEKLQQMQTSSTETEVMVNAGSQSILEMKNSLGMIQGIGQNLTNVMNQSNQVFESLTSIQDFSFSSKIISFNLAIEAARLGPSGATVQVIAKEMNTFSDKVSEIANTITETLEGSLGNIKKMNSEIQTQLASTAAAINSSASGVQGIITKVDELKGQIQTVVTTVGQQNEKSHELLGILDKITQSTANLSTASANVSLVEVNLREMLDKRVS